MSIFKKKKKAKVKSEPIATGALKTEAVIPPTKAKYPVTPKEAVPVETKRPYRPTLLLDFDGVIHSYVSGWQGVDTIPDPPVVVKTVMPKRKGSPEAVSEYSSIDWLRDLVRSEKFYVAIYSSRSKELAGINAMDDWLVANGLEDKYIEEIEFPTQKPAAFLTIDDRAVKFEGTFMTAKEIAEFKTWQNK
jgi:hypothetical protein